MVFVFCCLSSCLLLNNLKHLSLPIMNKQVLGCHMCECVCGCVCLCICVYLCSIWSHGAVTLFHQHVTVKQKKRQRTKCQIHVDDVLKPPLRLFDSSSKLSFLLCLMMSSWCNNVQISCCFFSPPFALLPDQQYWGRWESPAAKLEQSKQGCTV